MTWPSWGLACILLNRRLAFALSDLSRRRSSGEGALKITSMFMFIQHLTETDFEFVTLMN